MLLIKKPESQELRPISLTSCFDKLYETIIKNRLQWLAETNHWIPDSQHGFRKENSCSDNLVNLTLYTDSLFREGHEVFAAFLDVERAFNYVLSDVLIQKLADLGCL